MDKTKVWNIALSTDRAIDDIAADLANAGLLNIKMLREIDCITGSAPEKMVMKFRQIPGIIDISPDISIDLEPPNSPNTW